MTTDEVEYHQGVENRSNYVPGVRAAYSAVADRAGAWLRASRSRTPHPIHEPVPFQRDRLSSLSLSSACHAFEHTYRQGILAAWCCAAAEASFEEFMAAVSARRQEMFDAIAKNFDR